MLHYWILCRCGHHDTTPVQGELLLRQDVLRLARCSNCGARAAEDMRILWDAGPAPLESVHKSRAEDPRRDW